MQIYQFDIVLVVALLSGIIGYWLAWLRISGERRKALNSSRNVLKGQISEQIAPLLPNFPADLKISEGRFIGKPVDFIFFKGLDNKNIDEVVFLEVKSNSKWLNDNEYSLKRAVDNKRVKWVTYSIERDRKDKVI